MPRILMYCQHVLGMGHLMRSLALAEGLADRFDVEFLNGGPIAPGVRLPTEVSFTNLPPLVMDADFRKLETASGADPGDALEVRRRLILDTYERFEPDVVMIELFPFGRKRFTEELVPLLARVRRDAPDTLVVCSVRDILVRRPHQERHDRRVLRLLDRYFDLVLVHGDPAFHHLQDSFDRAAEIGSRVVHTGFVVPPGSHDDEMSAGVDGSGLDVATDLPTLVASIGGGRVGCELLEAAVQASIELVSRLEHRLMVCTGPYIPDEDAQRLGALAAGHDQIEIRTFVPRFVDLLGQADLSISMTGYNTCMDLARSGVRSLVLPYTGGDNDEQTIRATKLAEKGRVGLLTPADLDGSILAERIETALASDAPSWDLDVDGVGRSVDILVDALAARASTRSPVRAVLPEIDAAMDRLDAAFGDGIGHLDMFLRDDDVGAVDDELLDLFDVCISRNVPINLEVIPDRLTEEGTRLLKDVHRAHPGLFELHQHGSRHVNHETEGKKHEFGPSRTYAQQHRDIARGKSLLEERLGERFFPAFTPPWNRCTPDTYRVLHELGFTVLSMDRSSRPEVTGYAFRELSISVDLFTWKTGAKLRPTGDILEDLVVSAFAGGPVGLMLHHEVMDATAFALLDALLDALVTRPYVRFHTFGSLLEQGQAALGGVA